MANFVSEKELEDEKAKRQEEWDKVRSAEDPVVAPEPEGDRRPLWAKLKEQTEKKEAEMAEAQKLKTMVRGLDDEEVGFLDFVDTMKMAEQKKKLDEEKALLDEFKQAVKAGPSLVSPSALLSVSPPGDAPAKKKPTPVNKQASLLSGIVKRKSTDETGGSASKRVKSDAIVPDDTEIHSNVPVGNDTISDSNDDPAVLPKSSVASTNSVPILVKLTQKSAISVAGVRPAAMHVAGIIPGLNGYISDNGGSDNSESDSDSSSDGDDICSMAPSIGVKLRQQGEVGGCGGGSGRQPAGAGKTKSAQAS